MSAFRATTRGWCPGALRPMESGDGLIVRLRISGGVVPVGLAADVAGWSSRWGNGLIGLSSRANLQLRGIAGHHLTDLHDALAEWNLLDASDAGEAVRNVISSPLAGLDPTAVLDVRPVVGALGRHLSNDATLHGLPGKFGFAIDDGGSFGLRDVPADIQFVARGAVGGPAFDIYLDTATKRLGPCQPYELVAVADALSRVFLRLRAGQEARIRRMRDLVAVLGVEAVAREAGLGHVRPQVARNLAKPSAYLGMHMLGTVAFMGVGLPFGRIAAEDLAQLASTAAAQGAGELRLTPWRAILAPVPSLPDAQVLSESRFIMNAQDPRCRIAACPGAPSCARGTTSAQNDAAVLAEELGHVPGSGIALHVSGCEKGCAHPRPAAIALVGRDGRYDLVRDGLASDAPVGRGLTVCQATEQVRRIMASQAMAASA